MFLLKKGHQPGVYVPLRALFLVLFFALPVPSIYYYCHFFIERYEHYTKRIKLLIFISF